MLDSAPGRRRSSVRSKGREGWQFSSDAAPLRSQLRLPLGRLAGGGRALAVVLLLPALLLCAAAVLWWRGAPGDAEEVAETQLVACEDRPLRGKVYLNYGVIYGLCNQLLSHVNAVTLALAAGLDGVVLPPAWSRPHFNHSVEDDVWNRSTPITTLIDVGEMRRRLEPAGIEVFESTQEEVAVLRQRCFYVEQGFHPLESMPRALWRIRSLLDTIRREWGPADTRCFFLERFVMFWAHDLGSAGNASLFAADALAFNPTVEAVAEGVASAIGGPFNGAHMRLEADMKIEGEKALPLYIGEMRRLGFNASTPLYAASGLLSYNDTAAFQRMEEALRAAGVCSRVVAKEFLLPDRLAGLHSEQLALVDLLVLTRSALFVGHKASTFSYYARDLRARRGLGGLETTGMLEGGMTWESGTVIAPHE